MKLIKCKFCDRLFKDADSYADHLEKNHNDMIPADMTARQFYYYLKTGRTSGNCVMCKRETTWNPKTNKYSRFCTDPKCKEKYIEVFKNRMIGKYGKVTLLNDPEQQKKMLANRSISGEYRWSDGTTKTYTGSYEESFLEFLDKVLEYDSSDVICPSPHTYWYEYEGKKHFYIPDMFIASLNLEVEIKDGGDNANMHHKIQAVDKVKEKLKDEVLMSNKDSFNYIKIVNKENDKFFKYLMAAKQQFADSRDGKAKPIFMP